jgi:hypothetical protein
VTDTAHTQDGSDSLMRESSVWVCPNSACVHFEYEVPSEYGLCAYCNAPLAEANIAGATPKDDVT